MAKKTKKESGLLIQFWSIVNVAYLSMSNIDLKSSSKAPIRMPPELSRRLLITSSFISINTYIAYSLGNLKEIFLWDLLCLTTSINYWRDSRYDWRRTADMIVSMPLFIYHIIVAIFEFETFQMVKYIYLLLAAFCAFLFWVGFLQSDRRFAQITHSMMHIIGAFSSAWMYHYLSQERELISKLSS